MRIISKGDRLVAIPLPNNRRVEWIKGGHYANVWQGGTEVDVFSFAWEKNHTSMLDFTSALQSYLEDDNVYS